MFRATVTSRPWLLLLTSPGQKRSLANDSHHVSHAGSVGQRHTCITLEEPIGGPAESHPLLTARTWYEDSCSDLEGEEEQEHEAGYSVRLCGGAGVDQGGAQAAAARQQYQNQQQQELLELRASLAVQTKQSCHLQATMADQAAKIDR